MFKKILIKILISFIFIFNFSVAEIINEIKVTGNDRISKETIILFSGLNISENITDDELNESIKKLYKTSFFKSISISIENNILLINLTENPLIQSITINGIKIKSLRKQIKDFLIQKEKSSFVESKIKLDQDRIINSLRTNGYYFSNVSTNVKQNENNTVDIIYEVNLGNKALIKNIKFVGNKVFKDNKLRKFIASEEAKFWKFLSNKNNVD